MGSLKKTAVGSHLSIGAHLRKDYRYPGNIGACVCLGLYNYEDL